MFAEFYPSGISTDDIIEEAHHIASIGKEGTVWTSFIS